MPSTELVFFGRFVAIFLLVVTVCGMGCTDSNKDKDKDRDKDKMPVDLLDNDPLADPAGSKCIFSNNELRNMWGLRLRNRSIFTGSNNHKTLGELIESPISFEDFNAGNVKMRFNWRRSLFDKIDRSNYAVVMWSSNGDNDEHERIHISEYSNPQEVAELLESIFVNEEKEYGGGCRCGNGDGVVAFYRKDKKEKMELITVITLHHRSHINWYGWPDDGELTEESKAKMERVLRKYECSIMESADLVQR